MSNDQLGSGESRLETAISYLLIIGVVSSLIIEIAGMVMLYLTYRSLAISDESRFLIRGNDFFTFIYQQVSGTSGGSLAVRLMILGIIILMLTPFLRVIVSAIYFAVRRNWKYAVITLFVLVVLALSLGTH